MHVEKKVIYIRLKLLNFALAASLLCLLYAEYMMVVFTFGETFSHQLFKGFLGFLQDSGLCAFIIIHVSVALNPEMTSVSLPHLVFSRSFSNSAIFSNIAQLLSSLPCNIFLGFKNKISFIPQQLILKFWFYFILIISLDSLTDPCNNIFWRLKKNLPKFYALLSV